MNVTSPRLEVSIRAYLVPHLKQDGFSGSGRTFRRVTNNWIQVVNVQSSRYGGQFAINLGPQYLFVPDSLGNLPNPKKIPEPHCDFRRRLAEKTGSDQWWDYGSTQVSMDLAVDAAAKVYVEIGRPLLNQVAGTDSPFHSVTAEDFNKREFDGFLGFCETEVRTALVMARIRRTEGRVRESKDWAAYGLAHVGRATGLRAELEQLKASE